MSIRASPNWSGLTSSARPGNSSPAPISCRSREHFVATRLAGEPIVVVRGSDGTLRAFYNVCRHHAAAVVTQPCGHAEILQCPYHGWKYGLDGSLKGMPEFDGVQNFDRAENGLVPIRVETWECFVFVNLDPQAAPLAAISRRPGEARCAARRQQAALLRPPDLRHSLQLEGLRR